MYNFEKCPQTSVLDISATAVSDQTLKQVWNETRIVVKKKGLTHFQTKKIFKILKAKVRESKYASEAVKKRALRDIVMFSLALDSALRGGDLMSLRVGKIYSSNGKVHRDFILRQQKTKENVECAISRRTAKLLQQWKEYCGTSPIAYLFAGCGTGSYFSLKQYSRIIKGWVEWLDLPPEDYSTHSMRRSRAMMLYNKCKDLQIVRIILGHVSIQSTQEYLDCDVAKALAMARRIPAF